MLLSAAQWLHTGPPPQEILDQLGLWKFLIVGFTVVLVLKVIVLDIAGALLTGLLLGFGWIMLAEGMQEMPKYALIYAVLCGLNFLFDILPLMSELCGRSTRTTHVNRLPQDDSGTFVTQYTLVTKTSSFFDPSMGMTYNVESVSMLLEPCFMALGCYLATVAHHEIQRTWPSIMADDFVDESDLMDAARPMLAQDARLRSAVADRDNSNLSYGQDSFLHFQGNSYKLRGSRSPSPNPDHRR